MPDDGLLRISGAQEPQPDKYVSLAFIKMIGGLQTQRSPFQSLDNRYNTKFLGGKPDALFAGRNVEINNDLLLQRRPGLSPYGPSIDPPIDFFSWEIATTGDIDLVVDTKSGINSTYGQVLRYSPTYSGVYLNKAQGSAQTNFLSIVNTLYMGDGIDLFKNIGPNLLLQSNNFLAHLGTISADTSAVSSSDSYVASASVTLTPSTSREWAIVAIAAETAVATTPGFTAPSGWTQLQPTVGSDGQGISYFNEITGTVTPTIGFAANAVYAMCGATFVSPANTGPAVIQSGYSEPLQSPLSTTFSFSSAVTAGNSILLLVEYLGVSPLAITSLTDSLGNNYQLVAHTTAGSGNQYCSIYLAENIIGGSDTVTIVTTGVGAQGVMWCAELANLIWIPSNVALTPGQLDPTGGTAATELTWSTTGQTASLDQFVIPNYTPIAKNTFTFSVWMMVPSGSQRVELQISDQNGVIATAICDLTNEWVQYQVTGTMGSGSNIILVQIVSPTTLEPMNIYGAQLEVGGPATTTQFTTTQPQGIYLWGILAPSIAPTLTYENAAGSPGFPPAWAPDTAYDLGDVIIDSNGDLEVVTTAGTSGATQPTWAGLGGTTSDGLSNAIVQTNSAFALASTLTVPFLGNVTADNTLFGFLFGDIPSSSVSISFTDSNSNSWTLVASIVSGDQHAYLYASTVAGSVAGATSVTATFSSPSATGMWLGIAEIEGLSAFEVENTNGARDTSGTVFNTGAVTTIHPSALLITFATFSNNVGPGSEIGTQPSGYQTLGSITNVQSRTSGQGGGHYLNLGVACEFLSVELTVNPSWTISSPQSANSLTGITAAYTTTIGTLVWTNYGPVAVINGVLYNAGLTPSIGYTYYYAFMNSITGHVSNVSVASINTGAANLTTGALVAQIITVSGVGMQTTPGPVGPVMGGTAAFNHLYTQDPQVDTIAIFRNTDGGAFFFQIAQIPNPGTAASPGTWSFSDVAPDNGITVPTTYTLNGGAAIATTEALNNEIYAPIGLLNSLPPSGLVDFDYFAGRMWGSVGSFVYYNTAADNATLLGITQNGVPAESWAPANVVPYNAHVTRIVAVGGGLFVSTILDSWFLTGQNLLTGGFNPQKILIKHGMRSYNALDVDGSSIYMYTSDHQFLCVNANSGSVEFGFPIGDVLEEDFSPLMAYIVRHVSGSRDNAVFLADGMSTWYRLNPNQQGASMSGEQTPVWSPLADFSTTIGGVGAVASIETAPGVIQLLVGQTVNGPVLYRNLDVFTDDGDVYSWSATIGSILLTTPGKLAETESITSEMNAVLGSTQCNVAVLLEEIAGNFEILEQFVNDPPQLNPSVSVLSNRFYLSQGTVPPLCRHMQIQLTSGTVNGVQQDTQDVLLGLTVRGCLVSEQV